MSGLRRWRSERGSRAGLVVLSGPAGVGKSALAVRWLGELRDEFPDGQLFVSLGAGTEEAPVAPSQVLEWFLVSLGVPAGKVPVEPVRREVLYRTVAAERRLMVFLDDALSAGQVRSLVPAGSHSLAVVTSRFRLSGLAMDGAHWVEVGPLDRDGSLEMLRAILGPDRVAGELEAAAELAVLCGGMPLALSVVGARLSTRPRRRLAREADELRFEHGRLSALSLTGDVSVEAVMDHSYDGLGEEMARLYRLCAAHPGREFGVEVAAAALTRSIDHTESTVDMLVEANFLTEARDGRFMYHDLLRVHAQQRASREDSPEQRAAGLRRMIEWYLQRTVAADRTIHPLRPRVGPLDELPDVFSSESGALSWLETERSNLRAALDAAVEAQWHELVWQLCESLWGFFLHTRHYGDWIAMHGAGICSARQCGNRRAEARLRSQLGFAYAKLGRLADAVAESQIALELASAENDDQAMATALSQLGRAARRSGDLPSALSYFTQSRDIQRTLRRPRGVALCRRRIGDILSRLGRYAEAVTELESSVETMHELGDRTQYARSLMFLGATHLRADRLDQARPALLDALAVMRELGSPYYQAEILAHLGQLAEHSGDIRAARECYAEAAELYAAVQDPQAEIIGSRLAALDIPPQR